MKDFTGLKGHTKIQWAVATLANLTLTTYGLQSGWMSPMAKVLQSASSPVGRSMSDEEISWLASSPSLVAVAGVFVSMYIADNYGRKFSIMIITVSQSLCWIIKLLPSNFPSLIIARCLSGYAAGACFHAVPMYVKEIAQDNIRGALGSMFVPFHTSGVFLIYLLGGYLDYYVILWIVVGLPILIFVAFFRAPESPAFLVKQGKTKEATKTIAYLRGLSAEDTEVLKEVNSLISEHEYFESLPKMTFASILKVKQWRLNFTIMTLIMLAHGTNGAFTVVNYAAVILERSGVLVSPELQSLSIPIFMMVGSLLVMGFVDRVGRKPILLTAFILTSAAFTYLATALMLSERGWNTPGWLNVVPIVIVVFCYGGGVSPVPYIVMSEMFTFQIRAKLMGCLVMFACAMCFLQLSLFSFISNSVGSHFAFYGFACTNMFGAAVTLILLPETKYKATEESTVGNRKNNE